MRRQEAKALWPIIKAFGEGETIEYSSDGVEWSISTSPSWAQDCMYRIKPKPKLVPFTFEDNLLFKDRWLKPKGSEKDLFRIVKVCESWIYIENSDFPIKYDSVLNQFEFENGSPCGKYIE